ncbi:MAG: saccharopine dehydrogenase NADP-binding domain-containing protein, partial [Steroidobacteraceae bacterium]
MHRVLVLGAGKIGSLISGLLAESGSYQVHLADVDGEHAASVARAHGVANLVAHAVDARYAKALERH